MYLIVGLGNPEPEYSYTRHNMGFDTINQISEKYNIKVEKKGFDSLYGTGMIENEKVILCKPQTFMNLSGTSVREIVNYFKIDISDIIVVYDDMALPVGSIRLRPGGSSGGHKGMQNIIDELNNSDIKRIRIGIGEPTYDTIDYVLSKPSKEERVLIDEAITKGADALKDILKSNFDKAMTKYN